MSNGTKKNIKIIIPSSLDDEGARMLVIPLPTHNYGPGKRGTIILREELIEWIASLPKGIGNGKPGELHED